MQGQVYTVDISALEKLVDFFSARGHPIVVIFNYGTTFKGSCHDVEHAGSKLVSILKKNKMYERVHVSSDDSFVRAFRFMLMVPLQLRTCPS